MSVDLSWMDRIACAGMDPALFFARAGKSEVAELVCAKCPVQEKCNAWGGDATVGIWGGETRRRKPAAPKPAPPAPRKGSRMICDCGHTDGEHCSGPELGLEECMVEGCLCMCFEIGDEPTLAPRTTEA